MCRGQDYVRIPLLRHCPRDRSPQLRFAVRFDELDEGSQLLAFLAVSKRDDIRPILKSKKLRTYARLSSLQLVNIAQQSLDLRRTTAHERPLALPCGFEHFEHHGCVRPRE